MERTVVESRAVKGQQGASLLLRDFAVGLGALSREPLDARGAGQALGNLVGAFRAHAGGYFLRPKSGVESELLAEVGEGDDLLILRAKAEPLAGRAIEEGRALLRETGGLSMLAAPLGLGGQAAAALVLLRRGVGVQPFTDVDRAALQGGVEVLSQALGRPRLEARLIHLATELERREYRLFTINHMARVLGSVLEMDDLLRQLSDMVCEIITAESTVICLFQEEDGLLRTRCVRTLEDPRSVDFELPLREAFLDWVRSFEGRTSPVVAADDPRVQQVFPELTRELVGHDLVLFTPLAYKERFLGVLAVGRKYTGDRYGERDREFLSTLAPLASNAMSNAHLYDLAIHDTTTGLYMGHYFRQRVREEVKRAQRYGCPVSVIMFDLDYFKRVNDTLGHLTGDQVLRELAGVLMHGSRQEIDVIARYGGRGVRHAPARDAPARRPGGGREDPAQRDGTPVLRRPAPADHQRRGDQSA